jgi:hypothetical protein
MAPSVLCLIVLAMPFAVVICEAVSAARRKPRPIYARRARRCVEPGGEVADVHDDSALFQEQMELGRPGVLTSNHLE